MKFGKSKTPKGKTKGYEEEVVVDDLQSHPSIVIPRGKKAVCILVRGKDAITRKDRSKIDFLTNYCNYDLLYIERYSDIRDL